jgi:hypothetical protein
MEHWRDILWFVCWIGLGACIRALWMGRRSKQGPRK